MLKRAALEKHKKKINRYDEAVEKYIAKQQIASTMAYTSSWSGSETTIAPTSQFAN